MRGPFRAPVGGRLRPAQGGRSGLDRLAGRPPPRLEVLSSEARAGTRRVRARLVSARGAPIVLLFLPPAARNAGIAVEGIPLPEPPRRALALWRGYRLVGSMTMPPEGVIVEIVLPDGGPVEAVVADQSPGLPPSGAALRSARPATAVPSYEGDVTLATARVRL